MIVKIIGLAGNKTHRTLINAEEAASSFGNGVIRVEWVGDPGEMRLLGLMYTPSVVVNGRLKVTRRIPSVHEISTWIEEEFAEREEVLA